MFSTYDEFNNNAINDVNKLNYKFILNDRFIYVNDNDGQYFSCQTPFLKVLKPIHITLNKKKTISKKYLILETNDELDFNNQIGEFMYIINKIHEISQENIKKKSLTWFNTEFDDIGLDIKVRRPIDQQKDNEFIKISIPSNIEDQISKLTKGTYVLCNIIFKGLKISNDYINEEWEILDFITQEKYDEEQNEEFINNSVQMDAIQTLLENIQVEDVPLDVVPDVPQDVPQDVVPDVVQDVPEDKNEIKNIKIKSKISSKDSTSSKIKSKVNKNETIKKLSKKIIFN